MSSKIVQILLGRCAGTYLLFVGWTNRIRSKPENIYALIDHDMPVIVTMWHGEHFMLPFARRKDHRVQVLISNARDGEINSIAAKMLGMEVIRGSGGRQRDRRTGGKGGAKGLLAMVRSLSEGISVSMTADIPRGTSREASPGIITLARLSGRPILPVAFASTRFKRLDTWDKSVITLPFGRGMFVAGDLVRVAADADEERQETARLELETSLNQAYAEAYQIVGRNP
ncbi:lysophospholipid acyltransferase family protein [Pararhizobium sp. IMCC21322]|uniref:lysophospholipid acyltransferase family protein n=1 Tax=Pararhizobium sp. IMCC21322 TaxID=3067903 RepID=UPI002740CC13|nr:lysophospholipid acyltransferase family protein [Pararhizobium sp. IMCC21322]